MEMDLQTYLSDRADHQIAFYEKAAGKAKKAHLRLQTAIIVLGVLVPVLVNLPAWGPPAQVAVTALSLLLPVLSGLANFRKHGEIWMSYRMAEELLKNEKYLFLTRSGRYRDNPGAFFDFVESFESILAAEHNKFRAVFEEAKRSTGAAQGVPAAEAEAGTEKEERGAGPRAAGPAPE